ncbi:PREDICTED: homeobox protein BEL1 homolog [Ipomoea nil]|uniref:homeobox protein BEL1 homolog n=1 Tax=Ipomoea nil TaxID=35883 RepID=UPI0009015B6A|nr:PREDICTED: homeobox protein BEL1 homolog [Ipomoea nil]XP_019170001.1 PREDICTED: homeobox protein BEL1 homolog [Ipomoea nil]
MAGEEGEGKGRSSSMVTNTGYWYSDSAMNTQIQSGHMMSQLQSFEPNPEIYNLSSGMEMMVGFPFKNLQAQSDMWKPVPLSHSENMVAGGGGAPVLGGGGWAVEGNNNSNEMKVSITQKGLSLSLSSTNPSAIGFNSFDDLRLMAASSSSSRLNNIQHDEDDRFLGKPENLGHPSQDYFFQIRSSKYLGPAQELLKEFCCVGTTQSDEPKRKSQWQQDDHTTSSQNHSLGSLHFLELQKTKSKLLHLLDEVDRRYKHYRDQMTAVVSSFEAVAGDGAATVYSALASRVMSRHFRCLRDAILAQLKAAKKAMAEKESSSAAPGATKGETPRLKMIDQTLRQQKAIQQLTMMDSHPWRPQRGLPERSVSVLRAWLFEHFLHPYPSDVDKHILARQTGLSRSQVSNWFINARVRLWKPMVEEMYLEEVKEQDNIMGSSDGSRAAVDGGSGRERLDKKPNVVRLDSECISSLINIPAKAGGDHHQFGAVELDFSPYTHNSGGAVGYRPGERKTGGGGGVSLTLGLQQHGGSGIGLAFSPTSQNSLFYPRDQIGDCPPVQYSLLDGEGQNLPYRNLMGSQLLHDLAG